MKKNNGKKTLVVPNYLYDEQGDKVGVRLDLKTYNKLIDMVNDYHDYKTVLKYKKSRSK